jgi:integrase/recombinase XerD
MALEVGLVSAAAMRRLLSGPLLRHVEGFYDWLLKQQFGRRTVEKYLTHVSYLQAHLAGERREEMDSVSSEEIDGFLNAYPSYCPVRWRSKTHVAGVRSSIKRFVSYLRETGRFNEPTAHPLYEPLLNAYQEWLRSYRHLCDLTVAIYSPAVCSFLQWLGEDATAENISALTADRVERFFIRYAKEYPGNRRNMATALRSFLRFCTYCGYLPEFTETVVPNMRRYRLSTVPRGFTDAEAQKLLECIGQHTAAGRRDYTICLMFHAYGVRRGQICGLRIQEIDWEQNQILFKARKNGKDSLLPLTETIGKHLLSYLQNDRPRGTKHQEVFLTCFAPHRPLRPKTVTSMVYGYARSAGIPGPHRGTHAFRHGFATRMLQEGHPQVNSRRARPPGSGNDTHLHKGGLQRIEPSCVAMA